jgi:hypothetical protein
MARRFHLKNGARELRENLDTINYIYKWFQIKVFRLQITWLGNRAMTQDSLIY